MSEKASRDENETNMEEDVRITGVFGLEMVSMGEPWRLRGKPGDL